MSIVSKIHHRDMNRAANFVQFTTEPAQYQDPNTKNQSFFNPLNTRRSIVSWKLCETRFRIFRIFLFFNVEQITNQIIHHRVCSLVWFVYTSLAFFQSFLISLRITRENRAEESKQHFARLDSNFQTVNSDHGYVRLSRFISIKFTSDSVASLLD